MTGNDLPYITSATIDASAKKESTPVVRIAAGAVPARTASSSTAVVVDDPLLNGTARMRPAARTPASAMMLVDDLAGVKVVAAPERQRLDGDQRLAFGVAGDDRPADDHALCHTESSRTTRPSIADRTQSARLPKVTRVFSRLGA